MQSAVAQGRKVFPFNVFTKTNGFENVICIKSQIIQTFHILFKATALMIYLHTKSTMNGTIENCA